MDASPDICLAPKNAIAAPMHPLYHDMPRLRNDQTAVAAIVLSVTLSHSATVPAAGLCCTCLLGSDTEVTFAGVTGLPLILQLRSCCCGMKWACSSTSCVLQQEICFMQMHVPLVFTACTGVSPHGTACHLCHTPPASTAGDNKPRSQCCACSFYHGQAFLSACDF